MAKDNYTRLCITGDKNRAAIRLDKLAAALWPAYSRAAWQSLIRDGGVLVDGQCCRRSAVKIAGAQELAVDFSALISNNDNDHCAAEAISLAVIYEDDALLVVNKPPGMVVHPGHGNRMGTLQAAVLHRHSAAVALPRSGLVHRLDKDTSGLLVVAKTVAAHDGLLRQFKARTAHREYLALVHGTPPPTGVIDRPLGKHRRQPLRMTIGGDRDAVTRYAVRRQWRDYALLSCRLETGRTHQIRAHLEHGGFPVVGDRIYRRHARPTAFTAERQMLHATCLRLTHPASGQACQWTAPPPPDMRQIIAALGE